MGNQKISTSYSLLEPIAQSSSGSAVLRPRKRGPGLAESYKEEPVGLKNPLTLKMQEIKVALHLTSKQLSMELNFFYEKMRHPQYQITRKITPEVLQSYLQGFVHSDHEIERMHSILNFFAAHKIQETLYPDKDMRGIINLWFARLGIDPEGSGGSPYRLLIQAIAPYRKHKWAIGSVPDAATGKIVQMVKGTDHTTLFRWYQGNRKPRSNLTIRELDDAVRAAAKE